MRHVSSPADLDFRNRFESDAIHPAAFDHRAHLRLAYVYLTEQDVESAHRSMRESLRRFIEGSGIDPSKYHETMTRAWILAVRHFMAATPDCESADAFIDRNAVLLDSKIMLTHYSRELLFSGEARGRFVAPDLAPIPEYRG